MRYIIIGASAAGINAAKTLLQLDQQGEIIIISSDEQVYSRCMLHFVIAGKRDIEGISFIEKDFFQTNGITWMKGKQVTDIHFSKQEVEIEDGTKLSYDKLLLAAGAKASIPPIKGLENAENVFTLRDISDAYHITHLAASVKKAVIIGAGLVGMDAASALISLGLQVTLIELADRILPLQLDAHSAYNYQKRMEELGATVLTGVSVSEAVKEDHGNVTSIILSNGIAIDCDMIVVAAGVRPNTEFISSDEMKMDRGIRVDDQMRASVANVYAAGDITGISGIWPSATKQGVVAAYNMVGIEKHFDDYFSTKNAINLFGLGTVSIGTPTACDNSFSEILFEKDGVYKKLIHKDGIVYGVILQNDVSGSGFWMKVIKDKIKIDTKVNNIFYSNYGDFFSITEQGKYEYVVQK